MAEYCNLPGDAYWTSAEFLLLNAYGSSAQPNDVYAPCDGCDHVGWRWHHGAERLCQLCRATRLRAAELSERFGQKELEDQGPEKPSKATREAGQDR